LGCGGSELDCGIKEENCGATDPGGYEMEITFTN
tara:strand:- start:1556 stop:1657 length:102 start_codon:yes stop_codon:yes gene_type:complete